MRLRRGITAKRARIDAEMDRKIEELVERERAKGNARPKSPVKVRRVKPR